MKQVSYVDDPVVERILDIMEERGINQKEMAAKLGISGGSFSKWKNQGSKSYAKYLRQLSEILNVSASYLLNGSTDGDRKNARHMYSENTRAMIKIFDSLSDKEQLFILNVIRDYKNAFGKGK